MQGFSAYLRATLPKRIFNFMPHTVISRPLCLITLDIWSQCLNRAPMFRHLFPPGIACNPHWSHEIVLASPILNWCSILSLILPCSASDNFTLLSSILSRFSTQWRNYLQEFANLSTSMLALSPITHTNTASNSIASASSARVPTITIAHTHSHNLHRRYKITTKSVIKMKIIHT